VVVTSIRLEGLRVERGGAVLLDDLDLEVAAGERLAVLGASGAGKTTLLRALAGVERVAAGRILLGGRDVTDLPPRDRGVGLVTQESTLQPHLDVRGNLAFPLAIRHVPDEEVDRRVEAEARAFSLRGLLARRPRTLSAGKQHEVALARTLVRRVEVLLVDEPFAHLDPPRRVALQRELLELQSGYGLTLVLATNDQRVALTCGERVAVLEGGRLVQVAPPMELYHAPATTFVAGFIGDLPMDLYLGAVYRSAEGTVLDAGPLRVRSDLPVLRALVGHPVRVGVRPTAWRAPTDRSAARSGTEVAVRVVGVVRRRAFLGAEVAVTIDVHGIPVNAVLPTPGPGLGETVQLTAPRGELHLFDADRGKAVAHGV
jgi:multiple sugar transport system ATP-binding protein